MITIHFTVGIDYELVSEIVYINMYKHQACFEVKIVNPLGQAAAKCLLVLVFILSCKLYLCTFIPHSH